MVGPEDYVLGDELNHASIVDGCRFSGARFLEFRHNDVDSLRQRLREASGQRTLVVVDAVYSMEGDIADLPRIVEACRQAGALLMVDEAHSLGVLGTRGRGVQEHFALPPDAIDVKMGTLSKSTASCGGFIAGKREIIRFLKRHARGFIFSVALPAPQVAAALKSLEILQREPERVERLREVTRRYVTGLRDLGFRLPPTKTPIVPILCDSDEQTLEMARRCREGGLFVIPILYPAVPRNAPRIRTNVMAGHSEADIDFALNVFGDVTEVLQMPSFRGRSDFRRQASPNCMSTSLCLRDRLTILSTAQASVSRMVSRSIAREASPMVVSLQRAQSRARACFSWPVSRLYAIMTRYMCRVWPCPSRS